MDEVAGRTSNAIGTDDDSGALFDETAGWYSRLRIRSEKIIIDNLNSNVREALRPYRNMYVCPCIRPLRAFLATDTVLVTRGQRSVGRRFHQRLHPSPQPPS